MKNLLIIAPHPDDEIIGIGGTIAKRIKMGFSVFVCFVCRGKAPLFREEDVKICREETSRCHNFLGVSDRFYLDFPSVLLEKEDKYKINDAILNVIKKVDPEEVFIPHYGDMQMDHRIVAEASMVALRPKYKPNVNKIYGYETLSETGWNTPNVQNEFIPNTYIDISEELNQKLEALKFYKSQLGEFPETRSLYAVESLARYRGAMVQVEAAEAFMLLREIQ